MRGHDAFLEGVMRVREQDQQLQNSGSASPSRTPTPLEQLLTSEDPTVSERAASLLRGTTDPKMIESLVHALGSDKKQVVLAAASALKGTENREALQALSDIALQPNRRDGSVTTVSPFDEVKRDAAIAALQGTSDAESLKVLTNGLKSSFDEVRLAAIQALRDSSNENVRQALQHVALTDSVREIRGEAAQSRLPDSQRVN